jgi:hypothetical protein
LNNQLVKKRYGNDPETRLLTDYCFDLVDQPLVEIGEVNTEDMGLRFKSIFSWLSIAGRRLS